MYSATTSIRHVPLLQQKYPRAAVPPQNCFRNGADSCRHPVCRLPLSRAQPADCDLRGGIDTRRGT